MKWNMSTQGFDEAAKTLGNVRTLYHGINSARAASVIATGLKTPNQKMQSVTGQMFGPGIYFSDSTTKVAQYVGNKFTTRGAEGVMLECDVVMGNSYKASKEMDGLTSEGKLYRNDNDLARVDFNDIESVLAYAYDNNDDELKNEIFTDIFMGDNATSHERWVQRLEKWLDEAGEPTDRDELIKYLPKYFLYHAAKNSDLTISYDFFMDGSALGLETQWGYNPERQIKSDIEINKDFIAEKLRPFVDLEENDLEDELDSFIYDLDSEVSRNLDDITYDAKELAEKPIKQTMEQTWAKLANGYKERFMGGDEAYHSVTALTREEGGSVEHPEMIVYDQDQVKIKRILKVKVDRMAKAPTLTDIYKDLLAKAVAQMALFGDANPNLHQEKRVVRRKDGSVHLQIFHVRNQQPAMTQGGLFDAPAPTPQPKPAKAKTVKQPKLNPAQGSLFESLGVDPQTMKPTDLPATDSATDSAAKDKWPLNPDEVMPLSEVYESPKAEPEKSLVDIAREQAQVTPVNTDELHRRLGEKIADLETQAKGMRDTGEHIKARNLEEFVGGLQSAKFRLRLKGSQHERENTPETQQALEVAIKEASEALEKEMPKDDESTPPARVQTEKERILKPVPEDLPIKISHDDVPYSLAYDAHRHSSFSPDTRAYQRQQDYVNHITEMYRALRKEAKTPEQEAVIPQELQRYRDGYLERYKSKLNSDSRTASTMITGGSNFNVRRNQKRLDAAHNKLEDLIEYTERASARAIKNVKDAAPQQFKDDQYTEMLKKEAVRSMGIVMGIDKGQEAGHRPLFVTSIAEKLERAWKNGNQQAVRDTLLFIQEKQNLLPKPLFSSKHKIWKLLDQPIPEKKTGSETVSEGGNHGASMTLNHAKNGVEIKFPSKPPQEVLDRLSSAGFRFSRFQNLWYAKQTPRAVGFAEKFVNSNETLAKGVNVRYFVRTSHTPNFLRHCTTTPPDLQ
jgi:hypothetical protein